MYQGGKNLSQAAMAAKGNRSGSQAFAPDTIREQVGEDEDGNPIYKYFQQGVTYDKNTNKASTYKVEVGEPLTAQGETIKQKREQDAKAAANKKSMTEQAAIDVKTANDNVEKLAFAEKRIKFLSETGKLNAKNLDLLKTTSINRKANIEKAKSFRDALQSGLRSSGVGRQTANFLPIGVWTDQGSFDEIFNSFAEVAARERLKASGELRPTDADVQGMKAAMFGIGRSEEANIALLNDFISEQESMEAKLQQSQASTVPKSSEVVTVTSQEDFDLLPSGAIFIEDGVEYQKP